MEMGGGVSDEMAIIIVSSFVILGAERMEM
jgi:hypothetical protein